MLCLRHSPALPLTIFHRVLRSHRTSGIAVVPRRFISQAPSVMTMAASDIITRLRPAFDKAKESGDLLFFPSTIETHTDESGLEFQIRVCPALQHKPKLPTPHFDPAQDTTLKQGAKHDPFLPPYVPNLYVGELMSEDGDYVVLLNKYSVVEEHFLLVTKNYQSQQSPLFPSDLLQAYDLLDAARRGGRPFFGFYNCGDRSGASQHHKHLQFLPGTPPLEALARAARLEVADRPFTLPALPYANHVVRLPPALSSAGPEERAQTLAGAFLSVLDLAIATVRHAPDYPAGPPSYNVILTPEHIHVIPRQLEYATLASGEPLSVNSLGFAGCVLVKSEEELEAVKREGLTNILRGVALESVHDLQVAGQTNEAPGLAS